MVSKLLHYMGQYNTNTKFSHAIFGKLRIYFERSTKLFSPVNLNIKSPQLNDLICTLLVILIFLLIIFNFKIFAGIKALVYKYTGNFLNHFLSNITSMLSPFFYILKLVYKKWCFLKQVFNNYFFESNGTLNNNFYKKQTLNLNLKKLCNGFKLNSNFRFFKKRTYGEFYLNKYTLNSNFYKKQTLKLNRFNGDLRKQRWFKKVLILTNNSTSPDKVIQDEKNRVFNLDMWWGEAMRKTKMKESLVRYRKFNLTPNRTNLALLEKIKIRPYRYDRDSYSRTTFYLLNLGKKAEQRYDWTTKNPPGN